MELLGLLSLALSHFKFVLSHDKVEDVSIKGVRKEIKTLQNYKHYLMLQFDDNLMVLLSVSKISFSLLPHNDD